MAASLVRSNGKLSMLEIPFCEAGEEKQFKQRNHGHELKAEIPFCDKEDEIQNMPEEMNVGDDCKREANIPRM